MAPRDWRRRSSSSPTRPPIRRKLGRTPLTVDIEVEGAGVAPLLRPKKEERCPPFEEIILAEEQRDARGASAAALRRADPRRRPADRQRRHAQGEEGRVGPAAGQQLAPDRRAGDGRDRRRAGRRPCRAALWLGCAARPRRDRDKRRACRPSPFRIGRCSPRRPKRGRRARSRRRRSRSTTKPRRRRARRCARPRCAEPGSTSCSSGCRQSSRERAADGATAGSSARRVSPTPPPARRSSRRFAASSPIRASPRLFGPGSLGEAPLAATLPDGRVIAGTVDRLLVEDDRVSVIDFKTGRVPATDARDSERASRADGRLCRSAAGHLPGAAGQRVAACTQPARNSSNSCLERQRSERPYAC